MAEKRKHKIMPNKMWRQMQRLYAVGVSINEIARRFDYDPGNLCKRLKKYGIITNDNAALAQAQDIEIEENKIECEAETVLISDFSQKIKEIKEAKNLEIKEKKKDDDKVENEQVSTQNKEQLELVNSINHLAMTLMKNLLVEVYNMSNPRNRKNGGYEPMQAAIILRTLGLKYNQVLNAAGITPARFAEEVANTSQNDDLVQIYIPDNGRN